MTQRIDLAPLDADVDSNRGVNYATNRAHLVLVEGYPTFIADHFIALTDFAPGTTHYYSACPGTPVTQSFALANVRKVFQPRSGGCG